MSIFDEVGNEEEDDVYDYCDVCFNEECCCEDIMLDNSRFHSENDNVE